MSIKITDDSIIPIGIFFAICCAVSFLFYTGMKEQISKDTKEVEMAKAGLVQKLDGYHVLLGQT
jgi:hypothetical protein